MRYRARLALATLAILPLLCASWPMDSLARPPYPGSSRSSLIVFFDDAPGTEVMIDRLSRMGFSERDIEPRRGDMVVLDADAADIEFAYDKASKAQGVTSVGTNGRVHALGGSPPDDPAYATGPLGQQLYLGPETTAEHSIHLESVWASAFSDGPYSLTPERRGTTIAVLDTGVSPSLLEDTGDYVSMWNYVDGDRDTADDAIALNYHGTRVASIIRANTDNRAGIAGVLNDLDARVLVYKCLDGTGSGSAADCQQAMRDAADAGAKIINASFGERATTGFGSDPDAAARATWQDTVDYCVARGALVVAAAGNSANDYFAYTPVYYPAACENALAVGSIDVLDGDRSSFSCYGPSLDLVAPGRFEGDPEVSSPTGIWSVPPSGAADTRASGTSFAAPVAAGTIGFLWSLVPDLPIADVARIATSTADAAYGPLPGFDTETGWGLLDAAAAYAEMTSTIPAQPAVNLVALQRAGLELELNWTPAPGANTEYAYGVVGESAYRTSDTSGRLCVPGSGTHTLFVRSFATDRWGGTEPATMTVTTPGDLRPVHSSRLAGQDRYETAAAISRASNPQTASAVVIALGTDWPDALSAAPLASAVGAPLLLSKAGSLPVATKDEVWRLDPDTVYVIGGEAAISPAVESRIAQAAPHATVTRLGGRTRYDTARLVAAELADVAGTPDTALVVSGTAYPDAVSGAPLAAALGWPILLTAPTDLSSATLRALTDLGVSHTVIVGGETAVGTGVMNALPDPTRIGGRTRYHTSHLVADVGWASGAYGSSSVGIATGRTFPDALAAGPYAAAAGQPIVLVDTVSTETALWLDSAPDRLERVQVFGGRSALSYDVEIDVMLGLRVPQ